MVVGGGSRVQVVGVGVGVGLSLTSILHFGLIEIWPHALGAAILRKSCSYLDRCLVY